MAGNNPSNRPIYTKDQLICYYDRIRLPEHRRKYDISKENSKDALAYLGLLQKYNLAAIPFENLSLHYSQYKQVSLHPDELFQKIVGSNGRGGYCMENNLLFGTVLRSLGYKIYSAGARVHSPGGYNGWSHMINHVTIDGVKYFVDVGFGANCPIQPIPLNKDETVHQNIAPASARLVWRNIDGNTDPDQRLWVYEHRINDASEWEEMYCFSELEFRPADYEIMNYYTSTSRRVWFTQRVCCMEMILGGNEEEEGEEVIGVVILQNDLKYRIRGETEKKTVFENEEQRLKALEEAFDIKLSPGERDGIRGMVSELPSK